MTKEDVEAMHRAIAATLVRKAALEGASGVAVTPSSAVNPWGHMRSEKGPRAAAIEETMGHAGRSGRLTNILEEIGRAIPGSRMGTVIPRPQKIAGRFYPGTERATATPDSSWKILDLLQRAPTNTYSPELTLEHIPELERLASMLAPNSKHGAKARALLGEARAILDEVTDQSGTAYGDELLEVFDVKVIDLAARAAKEIERGFHSGARRSMETIRDMPWTIEPKNRPQRMMYKYPARPALIFNDEAREAAKRFEIPVI